MKIVRLKFLAVIAILFSAAFILIAMVYINHVWLPSCFSLLEGKASSEQVRALVRPILQEKLLGEIGHPPDGDEGWYKLFLSESKEILNLDQDDRLDFFTIVALNVEFSPESIDTYLHLIRADVRPLSEKLSLYEKSRRFQSLDDIRKEKLLMLEKKAKAIYETGNI